MRIPQLTDAEQDEHERVSDRLAELCLSTCPYDLDEERFCEHTTLMAELRASNRIPARAYALIGE